MRIRMVLARRPLSLKGRGKAKYQTDLANEARSRLASGSALSGSLYVRAVWFHREHTTQDVVNILKLILDSMKGVVYPDDSAIVRCVVERVEMTGVDLTVADSEESIGIAEDLERLFAAGERNVLYIEVGELTSQPIVL